MSERPDRIDGFHRVEPPGDARWPWPVYIRGQGPPVLVMHELNGVSPELLTFATRVADAGFAVWLPVLAGPAPSTTSLDRARSAISVCLSREIHLFATRSTSPMATALRALTAHAAKIAGSRGAGVVGMCFSGGFALALAADESVLAAVAAQPSLPLSTPLTPWCARDLGLSDTDADRLDERLHAGQVKLYVTRFSADRISPKRRLDALQDRWGTGGVTIDEIPSGNGNEFGFGRREHSVLAVAPSRHRAGAAPERLEQTYQRVIEFLHHQLDPRDAA